MSEYINLTLTSVVFEFVLASTVDTMPSHLTLTSVVFECEIF